jgi:intracellular sulfur oxidation DsrE/DsrF family protein
MTVPAAHIALLVSRDLRWALELAHAWVVGGDNVTVVLLDTAVAAARTGHIASVDIREALDAGLAVAAEAGALQRRSLPADRLVDGVKVLDIDEVADLVAEGADRVVWL